MGGNQEILFLLRIGILFRRRALLGDKLTRSPFCRRILYGRAGDQEIPVISIIEMKEHLFTGAEYRGDESLFYTRIIRLLTNIGKERVALLALVGILEIVTELKAMIEVEPDRIDKRLS